MVKDENSMAFEQAAAEKIIAEKKLQALKLENAQDAKKDSDVLSAKDARHLAESTSAVKKHIFKFIREAAKEGEVKFSYSLYNICDKQVEDITAALTELGYKFELKTEADSKELEICW